MKPLITQTRLKERVIYDPVTGVFTWRKAPYVKEGDVAGSYSKDGYIVIRIDQTTYQAHRLAWLYVKGIWPICVIDHVNEIRDDNRWENIREANRSQNAQNVTKSHCDSKSGFLGVSWYTAKQRWSAEIMCEGKKIRIGMFKRAEDARDAYLSKKAELHPFFHKAA